MVKRFLLTTAIALAAFGASGGDPVARFDIKLSPEQRIQQAVSRLTFGARPGEIEEVRKLGVEKWIELQLHPEHIAENPSLEGKLQPLETLRLESADILKQYFPVNQPGMVRPVIVTELVTPEQMRKIYNGTAEERQAAIMALDPEKRTKVLAVIPDNVVEGLPDLRRERDKARETAAAERALEMRNLRPSLVQLLEPPQRDIAQRGTLEQRAALFASLSPETRLRVAAALPPQQLVGLPELRRMAMTSRAPQQEPIDELREAKLFRAIYSNRQLQEVLTDFWFNHFNVFDAKGQPDRVLMTSYERDAIRPHVLGKFKDLLSAVAHHPAMLYYLDNWESMSPDVFQVGPFAPGQFGGAQILARQAHGLNENYGRELLELHTLGVNGGYTQDDVIAVARCFTGWTIRQPNQKPEFVYAAFMHDASEKTVLGHKIAASGGESDGLEVIDILAHHPSTARFISAKLARHFVADDPPAALIESMARTFTKTDGDLRAVLETMFNSREFFSQGAWQTKLKSPLEVVVSAARALNADVVDPYMLSQVIGEMGEPLYSKEAPSGYKDNAEAWLSTANLMARLRFASNITNGSAPGVKVDLARWLGKEPAAVARELLGRDASPQTLAAIEKGTVDKSSKPVVMMGPETVASLVISSPEFQRR